MLSTPGPVLLLPNHVSWWDWIFIGVCLEEDWKFVTSSATAGLTWVHRKIMVNRRTFPVDITSPYAVKHMAEYLQKGGRLVLFPEGRISGTGSLMKLFDGTGFLISKTHPKVITAYIRGGHLLPFSRNPDRKRCFPRVSVHFSNVLTPPATEHASATEARMRITNWLRDQMLQQRFETEMKLGPATMPDAIAATARKRVKIRRGRLPDGCGKRIVVIRLTAAQHIRETELVGKVEDGVDARARREAARPMTNLDLYFQEVKAYPLLTRAQARAWASRHAMGLTIMLWPNPKLPHASGPTRLLAST